MKHSVNEKGSLKWEIGRGGKCVTMLWWPEKIQASNSRSEVENYEAIGLHIRKI